MAEWEKNINSMCTNLEYGYYILNYMMLLWMWLLNALGISVYMKYIFMDEFQTKNWFTITIRAIYIYIYIYIDIYIYILHMLTPIHI